MEEKTEATFTELGLRARTATGIAGIGMGVIGATSMLNLPAPSVCQQLWLVPASMPLPKETRYYEHENHPGSRFSYPHVASTGEAGSLQMVPILCVTLDLQK